MNTYQIFCELLICRNNVLLLARFALFISLGSNKISNVHLRVNKSWPQTPFECAALGFKLDFVLFIPPAKGPSDSLCPFCGDRSTL